MTDFQRGYSEGWHGTGGATMPSGFPRPPSDADRTVYLHPAQAAASAKLAFWRGIFIGGLIVVAGFIGWALL